MYATTPRASAGQGSLFQAKRVLMLRELPQSGGICKSNAGNDPFAHVHVHAPTFSYRSLGIQIRAVISGELLPPYDTCILWSTVYVPYGRDLGRSG